MNRILGTLSPRFSLAAGTALVFVLAFASLANGQCGTMCAPATPGGGMTCMVYASAAPICPTFMGGPGTQTGMTMTTVLGAGMSATCLGGNAADGIATAIHPSASGPNPTCSFRFSAVCLGTPNQTVTCMVTAADGLPVELMEFSVEDGAEADAKSEEASDEP